MNPLANGGGRLAVLPTGWEEETTMGDRTTKALLALIVLALWGLLLRPLVGAQPVHAQEPAHAMAMQVENGYLCIIDTGFVYVYNLKEKEPVRILHERLN
jgi:hypothetical protein